MGVAIALLVICAVYIVIYDKGSNGGYRASKSELKGKYGEKLTEDELKKLSKYGIEGKIIRNVYLPKDNGETSEVDFVFITTKGIFLIESKNYSGWIFGNENDKNWTATLKGGVKNQFYNPIWQNKTHVKWMESVVGESVPLYSIIAFSERCELMDITLSSNEVAVIKRNELTSTILDVWNNKPVCVHGGTIELICEKLQKMANVDENTKAAHIEAVNLHKERDLNYIWNDGNTMLCPKCGKPLVIRTARKGTEAGKQFYGCSGFPNCRYTQSFENI